MRACLAIAGPHIVANTSLQCRSLASGDDARQNWRRCGSKHLSCVVCRQVRSRHAGRCSALPPQSLLARWSSLGSAIRAQTHSWVGQQADPGRLDMATRRQCLLAAGDQRKRVGKSETIARGRWMDGWKNETCFWAAGGAVRTSGHAAWPCSLDMHPGHASWPCSLTMHPGHASRPCSLTIHPFRCATACLFSSAWRIQAPVLTKKRNRTAALARSATAPL
mmetsp:Transcript_24129/g.71601  ORF Transcript_24129/g.71601 Transcript_24129/m.71601 type:complete len:221 (+) Transcript_24129:512-1174(+)